MFRLIKRLLGRGGTADAGRQAARPAAPATPVRRPPPRQGPRTAESGNPRPDPDGDTQQAEVGFDPYNTGAFNRAASWDRISKRKNR